MLLFLLISGIFLPFCATLHAEDPSLSFRHGSLFLSPPLLLIHYSTPWNLGGTGVEGLVTHGNARGSPYRGPDFGIRGSFHRLFDRWVLSGSGMIFPSLETWGMWAGGAYQILEGSRESSSVLLGGGVFGGSFVSTRFYSFTVFAEGSKEVLRIPNDPDPSLLYLGIHIDQGYGMIIPFERFHASLSPLLRGYLRFVWMRTIGLAYAFGTWGEGIYLHSISIHYIPRGYP